MTKLYEVIYSLRNNGYIVDYDMCEKSCKAQMKCASKQESKYVCILGEEEVKNNTCMIKNMESGKQVEICFDAENIIKNIDNN